MIKYQIFLSSVQENILYHKDTHTYIHARKQLNEVTASLCPRKMIGNLERKQNAVISQNWDKT